MDPKTIKQTLKETYNTIAPDFDQTRKAVWGPVKQFLDGVPASSLVLDLGGGTGRHTLLAEQKTHVAICYDQSIGQLRTAKKNGIRRCVLGDITELPFRSETFDSILYIAALHHLPTEKERFASLEECNRILKLHGLILISVWARDQPKFKEKTTKDGDVYHTWRGKHERYYHLFTEDELRSLVQKANLVIEKCWKEDDNIWLVGKKQP